MINFRSHHILCAFNFLGLGYSPEFIYNFWNVKKNLREETKIKIINCLDDICFSCPNADGKKCKNENTVQVLDQKHSLAFNVKIGDIITWQEATNRIKTLISKKLFDEICFSCKWKKFKVCENNLSDTVWKVENKHGKIKEKEV